MLESNVFANIEEVGPRLASHGYVSDRKLHTVVFLASRLDKPILAEGPAGVGKTELAKAVAAVTGSGLVRLQCYEGIDEGKALYDWEYGKQLLYTQLLRTQLDVYIPAERAYDQRPNITMD